jgi:hypothetical protein
MSEGMNVKERLLHVAFNRLAEIYPCGLYEWLDKQGGEEISQLEERINQNFRNEGSADDLKSLLREYWTCHIQAIREFERRHDI